jgi:hypothetical protein
MVIILPDTSDGPVKIATADDQHLWCARVRLGRRRAWFHNPRCRRRIEGVGEKPNSSPRDCAPGCSKASGADSAASAHGLAVDHPLAQHSTS